MTMERLDALKMVPENQDPTKQFAIGEMKRLFTSAGLKDLEPKKEAVPVAENPSLKLLEQAVREFKEKPHTPETVTKYWKTLWSVWGEKAELSLTVPHCDRTAGEINQLEKEGRKLVYVPNEVASQDGRHLLGQIFPKIQSHSVREGNSVSNESNRGGWLDIEASLDSPNLDTKEKGLKNKFKREGRDGQRLNTYIVGSQDAKLQTGHYFDEKTASRLLGSRLVGRVVDASFAVLGLLVDWRLDPQLHVSGWGGRSEGVKRT